MIRREKFRLEETLGVSSTDQGLHQNADRGCVCHVVFGELQRWFTGLEPVVLRGDCSCMA